MRRLRRILGAMATVILLLLALATVVLWVRSKQRMVEMLVYYKTHEAENTRSEFSLTSGDGALSLRWMIGQPRLSMSLPGSAKSIQIRQDPINGLRYYGRRPSWSEEV